MDKDYLEVDELVVDVSVNTHIPIIELRIGNNTVFLSPEEAMSIAEALAEASSILEDLIEGLATAEPVDANTHQAPNTIQ